LSQKQRERPAEPEQRDQRDEDPGPGQAQPSRLDDDPDAEHDRGEHGIERECRARQVREQLDAIRSQLPEGELKKELNSVTEKMQLFGGTAAPTGARTLGLTTGRLRSLFAQVEGVDLAPTSQIISATAETIKDAHDLEESWKTFASADLPALNSKLKAAGLATIKIPN